MPKNAKLNSIDISYQIQKGALLSISSSLNKTIIGGNLPNPKILNVGCTHKHNIPLGVENKLFNLNGNTKSNIPIINPVYDVKSPGEKIYYNLKLTFTSNNTKTIILITEISPNYDTNILPSPPPSPSVIPIIPNGPDLTPKFSTKTPIKHVIILLLENQSFDSIFGTYPLAQNNIGENPFYPKANTPIPNNLLTIDPLTGQNYLTSNRNVGQNGIGNVNPIRFSPYQELTSFEGNGYTRLQIDVNNGLMNHYILNQPNQLPIKYDNKEFDATYGNGANVVMAYWDGNSYTGLWNYAQYYSMSDNCFTTGYGESIVGGINWGSGNNSPIIPEYPDLLIDVNLLKIISQLFSADPQLPLIPPGVEFVRWGDILNEINDVALFNWIFPKNDLVLILFLVEYFKVIPPELQSTFKFPNTSGIVQFVQQFTSNFISSSHKEIGDLLNKKSITWGSFLAGWLPQRPFDPNQIVIPFYDIFISLGHPEVNNELAAIIPNYNNLLFSSHVSLNPYPPLGAGGATIAEIIGPVADLSDIQPSIYYRSTTNVNITPPNSLLNVGTSNDGGANHNYDLNIFFNALDIGVLPAVSYIRLPSYQNNHNEESNAFDSQFGIINLVNKIMNSVFWDSTAIFIQYDESNGNYDNVPPPLIRSSAFSKEFDPCNQIARNGAKAGIKQFPLRPGYAPRIPFMVISPWAKQNYISHCITDQTSILKFIEDNWQLGQLGKCSYDKLAGSISDLFDFKNKAPRVILDPTTGNIVSISP